MLLLKEDRGRMTEMKHNHVFPNLIAAGYFLARQVKILSIQVFSNELHFLRHSSQKDFVMVPQNKVWTFHNRNDVNIYIWESEIKSVSTCKDPYKVAIETKKGVTVFISYKFP